MYKLHEIDFVESRFRNTAISFLCNSSFLTHAYFVNVRRKCALVKKKYLYIYLSVY